MANSSRRILDRNRNQFLPSNITGGGDTDHFFTTEKTIAFAGILLGLFIAFTYCSSNNKSIMGWVIILGTWFIISFYVTRYVIFQEKFYYRMYKQLKGNEITTPATFWNVASIKDTEDGAIMTYADGKVGIIVKLDRDTITGKAEDFEETHYDAISDFYRSLLTNKYCFVQMNKMEPAGKDPRLTELDKLCGKTDNENIRSLVELQIGHIKNIARASLYESDYILIYSYDIVKIDSIIDDTIESMFKILNGAYVGYKIMTKKDLISIDKDEFYIDYFDYTEAALNIYKGEKDIKTVPFVIDGVVWEDGNKQTFNNNEKMVLKRELDNVEREYDSSVIVSTNLKDKLYRVEKPEADNIGIDFNSLSDIGQVNRGNNNRKPMPRPKVNRSNNNQVNLNKQSSIGQKQNMQKNDIEASWDSSYIDGDDTIDF